MLQKVERASIRKRVVIRAYLSATRKKTMLLDELHCLVDRISAAQHVTSDFFQNAFQVQYPMWDKKSKVWVHTCMDTLPFSSNQSMFQIYRLLQMVVLKAARTEVFLFPQYPNKPGSRVSSSRVD